MRITLTAAEAVKITQLQGEVISAREHFHDANERFQASMGEALKRAKKEPKDWEGKSFLVKVEGENVYLETVEVHAPPEKK